MTVTDAPYCAVLSNTRCNREVDLGGVGHFSTVLKNTKGMFLENQECDVWIENGSGDLVGVVYSSLFDGLPQNYIDEKNNFVTGRNDSLIFTDSLGQFMVGFPISTSTYWYGDEYTVIGSCNGVETSCKMNVTTRRLPDTNEYKELGRMGGGLFLLFILVVLIVIYLPKRK